MLATYQRTPHAAWPTPSLSPQGFSLCRDCDAHFHAQITERRELAAFRFRLPGHRRRSRRRSPFLHNRHKQFIGLLFWFNFLGGFLSSLLSFSPVVSRVVLRVRGYYYYFFNVYNSSVRMVLLFQMLFHVVVVVVGVFGAAVSCRGFVHGSVSLSLSLSHTHSL